MKTTKPFVVFCLVCIGWVCFGPASIAAAGETGANWRPTYDLIMMYVNFGILAFALYKILKKPLTDFIRSRQSMLADEIEKVEKSKQAVNAELKVATEQLEQSAARLETIKERIAAQGENEKKRLVDEANLQSRILIENARRRIDSRFSQARAQFREELLNAAFGLVFERLPKEIGEEDNKRFYDQFLTGALN